MGLPKNGQLNSTSDHNPNPFRIHSNHDDSYASPVSLQLRLLGLPDALLPTGPYSIPDHLFPSNNLSF
ncbi:hypothetical protein XELAEV_18041656mg [Xenopus laevis]|uniref:Uncharacterized protein n=1 Tax=Xenopus laevis TaxID=8355 RepID=A0A974C3U1_XENLA|nr:hypothetical protein XELAEV_18041656mg [Xenopus laevis]